MASTKKAAKQEVPATKYGRLRQSFSKRRVWKTKAELMQYTGFDSKNLMVSLSTIRKEGFDVKYDADKKAYRIN